MGWKDVTPSDAVEAADWIPGRLNGFAKNVGSIVPKGFDAYARIFHPASKAPNYRPGDPVRPGVDVRWSEVAAEAGRIVHPEMQFHAIAAPVPGRSHERELWDDVPRLGVLSARQAAALVEVLPTHTTTPNACWLCLWEGYGYFGPPTAWTTLRAEFRPISRWSPRYWFWRLRLGLRTRLRLLTRVRLPRPPWPPPPIGSMAGRPFPERKRVTLPGRDYLLFTGSIAQAQGWEDGPNLWWPDDRAWCVASEIDFPYTYVGGSRELIEEILRHPDIEALPATGDDGVNYDSDAVNS